MGQAAEAGSLMYAVRLQLMINKVVLCLAALAAYIAHGPRAGRRPVRVHVFHVLPQVARRWVTAPAVSAHGLSVLRVAAQLRVQARQALLVLLLLPLGYRRSYNQALWVWIYFFYFSFFTFMLFCFLFWVKKFLTLKICFFLHSLTCYFFF